MTQEAPSRDTVFIEEHVHNVYKRLTEGTDPASVPFRTMKDVFMWATTLGAKLGARKPIAGKKVMIFRWAQFSPQTDIPLLKAIAMADTRSVDVLSSQADVIAIAEEYANAGIHDLETRVLAEYGQPLWNLLDVLTG